MAKARSESHAKLLDVLKRLDQIRPAAIPIETLRRMQAEIHADHAELAAGGFGDIHNLETPGGQVLTAILIVTGMVLVGAFTATLTSLFIGEQAEEIEKLREEPGRRLDQFSGRIDSRDRRDRLEEI